MKVGSASRGQFMFDLTCCGRLAVSTDYHTSS
jgi:hypothetical protein